jgi:hypothetical protein
MMVRPISDPAVFGSLSFGNWIIVSTNFTGITRNQRTRRSPPSRLRFLEYRSRLKGQRAAPGAEKNELRIDRPLRSVGLVLDVNMPAGIRAAIQSADPVKKINGDAVLLSKPVNQRPSQRAEIDMMALIGTPARSSQAGSMVGHCAAGAVKRALG